MEREGKRKRGGKKIIIIKERPKDLKNQAQKTSLTKARNINIFEIWIVEIKLACELFLSSRRRT